MRTYITKEEREELVSRGKLIEYGLHTQPVNWYINTSPSTMMVYLYSREDAVKMVAPIEKSNKIARVFYSDEVTSTGYLMPTNNTRIKTVSIPEDLQQCLDKVRYGTTTSIKGATAEYVALTMIKRGHIFKLPEGCTIKHIKDAKTRTLGTNITLEHMGRSANIQVRYDREGGKIKYHEPRPSIYIETHERNYKHEI